MLRLPAERFTALIREQPEFRMAVVAELGRRLREAEARIRDLQSERVERRLARALLRLANKTGTKRAGGSSWGCRSLARTWRSWQEPRLAPPAAG